MTDERDKYLSAEEKLEEERRPLDYLRRIGNGNERVGAVLYLDEYPELKEKFPLTAAGDDSPGEMVGLEAEIEASSREQRNALWTLKFTEEPYSEALTKVNAADEKKLALAEEGKALAETLTGPKPTVEPEPEPEGIINLEPTPKDKYDELFDTAQGLEDTDPEKATLYQRIIQEGNDFQKNKAKGLLESLRLNKEYIEGPKIKKPERA